MIEGTTPENFQCNCGGWNCRHQLVPVADAVVPAALRAKFEKRTLPPNSTQFVEPSKAIVEATNSIIKVERGMPMSFDEADGGKVNPHFEGNGVYNGYNNNCQSTTIAYSLRCMGWDVEAMPRISTNQEVLAYNPYLAFIVKGEDHIPPTRHEWKAGPNTSLVDWIEKQTKETGQYHFAIKYSIYGHLVAIDRLPDGTARIYDGQSGIKCPISNIDRIIPASTIGNRSYIYRVDNCEPNPYILEGVVTKAGSEKSDINAKKSKRK